MSVVAPTLESIVGADAVCSWEQLEDPWRSTITQALSLPSSSTLSSPPHPDCVVYPNTQAELSEVVACAHANRWRFLVCGSGSKLHWGGLTSGIHMVISTVRLNRLIDHAIGDLTVTAEAGMKFATLQAQLAEAGQFLALDPSYIDASTLGGIVATADAGSLRARYGGVRDMLIGISIIRTDGKQAKAGGQVVKNVAGYDLMKLFTGSYSTLGVISQVSLRIYPLPADTRTVVLTGTPEAIAQATATLIASVLSPTALDLITRPTVTALDLDGDMGLLVRFQSIEVSVEKQAEQWQQVGQALGLHSITLNSSESTDLWQRLREQMEAASQSDTITCKIGVLPSKAVEVMEQVRQLAPMMQAGVIHASSGLGKLRFDMLTAATLTQLRTLCQEQGGFLTVLEAPIALKQAIDVWGYPGNGLDLMRQLKQQFDPQNLLSPGRFVGGI